MCFDPLDDFFDGLTPGVEMFVIAPHDRVHPEIMVTS